MQIPIRTDPQMARVINNNEIDKQSLANETP